jgi:hypothetical protein
MIIVMAPFVTGGLKSAPGQLAQSLAKALLPLEQTGGKRFEPVTSPAAPAPNLNRHRLHGAGLSTQPSRTALVAPTIDASTPVIIVSMPQLDSSPPAPQSAASGEDAIVCRPPQQLASSRLMGPEVCLPKQEWARLKQQDLVLMPDGRTLATDFEKERSLNPRTCPPSLPNASSALSTWRVGCF